MPSKSQIKWFGGIVSAVTVAILFVVPAVSRVLPASLKM